MPEEAEPWSSDAPSTPPTGSLSSGCSPRARSSSRWRAPARSCPVSRGGCSCTPDRRSTGSACPGRCAARSPARSFSKAGPATPRSATELLASGGVAFEPCHHHSTVGPMAGVVAPSMAVWVVEDAKHGGRTFSTINEGSGKVMRFGAYSPEVLDKLRWLNETLAPLLARALAEAGPLDLVATLGRGVRDGRRRAHPLSGGFASALPPRRREDRGLRRRRAATRERALDCPGQRTGSPS